MSSCNYHFSLWVSKPCAKSKDTYNSFSIPYKLSYNVYIILVWNWIGVMESEHESVKGQVPAMGPIHIAPKVCTKNQLITKCDANNILQLYHRCIPGTEDDYYCNCVCFKQNCNGGACKIVGSQPPHFCHCNKSL